MNARIIKEARTLLPAMGVTLLLAVAPMVIWGNLAAIIGFYLLELGFVIMGAISFGNEYQHRTMSLLLTQPIARTTIWREKELVLGLAMGTGIGIFFVALMIFDERLFHDADFNSFILVAIFVTSCVFCAIPYWALAARSTIAGAVFALATSGAILLTNFLVLNEDFVQEHFPGIPLIAGLSAFVLIGVYSLVCYGLGYFRFRNLQVMDGGSQELSLPTWLETAVLKPLKAIGSRFTGHFAILVKKELRLQQLSFVAAVMLCLLVGIVVATSQQRHSDAVRSILGVSFIIYAGIIPLITGAASIAEEKGWGMADWHRTLPPSTLMQWTAKILVALSTSLGLGLVVPGALILAGVPAMGFNLKEVSLPSDSEVLALVPLVCGQMLVTSLAIYGGSLSSNTIRGILVVFGMVIAAATSIWIASGVITIYQDLGFPMRLAVETLESMTGFEADLLESFLPALVLLCLLGVILYFSFHNYRQPKAGKRAIALQLMVWMLLFGSITMGCAILLGNPFR
jgi:hypothetical protein